MGLKLKLLESGNPHPKAIEICEEAIPWRTISAVNSHSHPTSPAELQLQAASVGHVHGSRSCDVFLTMSFHLAFSFQIPLQDPRFMSQNVQNMSPSNISPIGNEGIPPRPSRSVKPRDSAVSGGFILLAEARDGDGGPAWQLHGDVPVMGCHGLWLIASPRNSKHPVPNHGLVGDLHILGPT